MVDRWWGYRNGNTVRCVSASDYDALAAENAALKEECAALVNGDEYQAMQRTLGEVNARLAEAIERAAAAESKEVCTVAHSDEVMEFCPYCKIERLQQVINERGDEIDILRHELKQYDEVILPSWKREEEMWREDERNAIEFRRVLAEKLDETEDALAKAAAYSKTMERDAARYRWIRANNKVGGRVVVELECDPPELCTCEVGHKPAELDAAIDAAMASETVGASSATVTPSEGT